MQTPAGGHSFGGVSGVSRSAVLRLEQVEVAAARDVERMSVRAEEAAVVSLERQMACADGTEEHSFEFSGRNRRPETYIICRFKERTCECGWR